MVPSGLISLALDAKARLKQRVVRWRQRLCALPGHCAVAVGLAGGRGHNQGCVLELRPVKGPNVLDDQLGRIAMRAIFVARDVEADDVEAFGEQSLGPAAEAAKEVDRQRAAHGAAFFVASIRFLSLSRATPHFHCLTVMSEKPVQPHLSKNVA
jgi:hypothetical protein